MSKILFCTYLNQQKLLCDGRSSARHLHELDLLIELWPRSFFVTSLGHAPASVTLWSLARLSSVLARFASARSWTWNSAVSFLFATSYLLIRVRNTKKSREVFSSFARSWPKRGLPAYVWEKILFEIHSPQLMKDSAGVGPVWIAAGKADDEAPKTTFLLPFLVQTRYSTYHH